MATTRPKIGDTTVDEVLERRGRRGVRCRGTSRARPSRRSGPVPRGCGPRSSREVRRPCSDRSDRCGPNKVKRVHRSGRIDPIDRCMGRRTSRDERGPHPRENWPATSARPSNSTTCLDNAAPRRPRLRGPGPPSCRRSSVEWSPRASRAHRRARRQRGPTRAASSWLEREGYLQLLAGARLRPSAQSGPDQGRRSTHCTWSCRFPNSPISRRATGLPVAIAPRAR